jgi:hypothetical protein
MVRYRPTAACDGKIPANSRLRWEDTGQQPRAIERDPSIGFVSQPVKLAPTEAAEIGFVSQPVKPGPAEAAEIGFVSQNAVSPPVEPPPFAEKRQFASPQPRSDLHKRSRSAPKKVPESDPSPEKTDWRPKGKTELRRQDEAGRTLDCLKDLTEFLFMRVHSRLKRFPEKPPPPAPNGSHPHPAA